MTAPAFKGGQGRSARSVEDDGNALLVGLVVLVSIALWWLLYKVFA